MKYQVIKGRQKLQELKHNGHDCSPSTRHTHQTMKTFFSFTAIRTGAGGNPAYSDRLIQLMTLHDFSIFTITT